MVAFSFKVLIPLLVFICDFSNNHRKDGVSGQDRAARFWRFLSPPGSCVARSPNAACRVIWFYAAALRAPNLKCGIW